MQFQISQFKQSLLFSYYIMQRIPFILLITLPICCQCTLTQPPNLFTQIFLNLIFLFGLAAIFIQGFAYWEQNFSRKPKYLKFEDERTSGIVGKISDREQKEGKRTVLPVLASETFGNQQEKFENSPGKTEGPLILQFDFKKNVDSQI